MTTLHIEHEITDFELWKAAFDRFAEARRESGVLGHRIRRPVDDPAYVVIDLEFESTDQAAGFLGFLRSKVWPSPEALALHGVPRTSILEVVEERQSSAALKDL
jgi:hypothetical protein